MQGWEGLRHILTQPRPSFIGCLIGNTFSRQDDHDDHDVDDHDDDDDEDVDDHDDDHN